ncbi:MAG: hypothetical protein DLM52_05075 [Chthoniobacterales bacterium]|nr:MAG: hypothetical protein DLM52_05075 [Chthoniobacterales bacterium]
MPTIRRPINRRASQIFHRRSVIAARLWMLTMPPNRSSGWREVFSATIPGPSTNEVWKYDVRNNVWSGGPSLPGPRAGGCAGKARA